MLQSFSTFSVFNCGLTHKAPSQVSRYTCLQDQPLYLPDTIKEKMRAHYFRSKWPSSIVLFL
ncbi:Uncharacterized protein APZ42_016390 [Daphnia magna]|uniref:Uncharacterized protein n=1 Tax=Daphnia magna TaxID=35525 RepID=A0A165ADZ4_9CRUS|nr:Uncharacterized protein APZ42_016390 [Daphnia magna]